MKVLNSDNFKEVTKDGLWIIDFYADWCGPCKMLSPVLESISYDNILKVNVDEHKSLSNSFGIMSIPTLVFLNDGKEIDKIIGFTTKEEIEKRISEYKEL